MKNFISYFKRNIYFMVSIITVIIASLFAITMFIVNDISNQPAQTTLGSIYLGGHESSQYSSVVTNEINMFVTQANYEIEYQDEIYVLPIDLYKFEKDETLNSLVDDQKNQVIFSMSDENKIILETELESIFSSKVINLLDMDKLNDQILTDLGQMLSRKQYHLDAYFIDLAYETELNKENISLIPLLEDTNKIAANVQSIEILPKSQFSLIETLGMMDLNNEQLSIIANGMLKVLMKSHMNGFTFETYPESPVWAPNGFNVRILKVNGYDFTFFNPYDFGYKIEIDKLTDSSLTFTLIGVPYVVSYDFTITLKTIIPSEQIYITKDAISDPLADVIIIETETETIYRALQTLGSDGKIVDVTRTSTNNEGITTSLKLYDVLYPDEPTIYEQYIVEKGGA